MLLNNYTVNAFGLTLIDAPIDTPQKMLALNTVTDEYCEVLTDALNVIPTVSGRVYHLRPGGARVVTDYAEETEYNVPHSQDGDEITTVDDMHDLAEIACYFELDLGELIDVTYPEDTEEDSSDD